MSWMIEFAESASKTLGKLDKPVAQRIIKFLRERVTNDPKAVGEALPGNLAPMWRYRVGDYRIICDIVDETVKVIGIEPREQVAPFEVSRNTLGMMDTAMANVKKGKAQ